MSLDSIIEVGPSEYLSGQKIAKDRARLKGVDKAIHHYEAISGESAGPVRESVNFFLSNYYSIVQTFLKDEKYEEVSEAVNLLALYAAANTASDKIDKPLVDYQFSVDVKKLGFSTYPLKEYKSALDPLIETMLKEIACDDTLERKQIRLKAIYHKIKRTVKEYVLDHKSKLEEQISTVSKLSLRVNGSIYTGFRKDSLQKKKPKIEFTYKKPTIIGNQEGIEAVDGMLDDLGYYNPKTGQNVWFRDDENPRPPATLLVGGPGRGKSLLIKYAIARLKEVADRKGTPVNPQVLNSKIKEKWHGQDIQNLDALFVESADPKSLSILCIDEAEGTLGRRDKEDSTAEKGNVAYLLDFMNGISNQYRGNYGVIIATNNPDQLDPALVSRCDQKIEIKGAQTPEEFASMFKVCMGNDYRLSGLTKKDLQEFGNVCAEADYSGREVDNVAKWAKRQIKGKPDNVEELHSNFDDDAVYDALTERAKKLDKKKFFHRTKTEKERIENTERSHLNE